VQQGMIDAEKVTAIMKDKKIDLVVSSPYKRAIQTIEGIANKNDLEIKVFEELRERHLGDDKMTEVEIQQAIKTSYENIDFSLTGGESIRDVQNRAVPVINNLLHKYHGKNIIIGTHGNVMTTIMNYFNKEYGYEFWKNTSKPDIYKLDFSGETMLSVQRIWE